MSVRAADHVHRRGDVLGARISTARPTSEALGLDAHDRTVRRGDERTAKGPLSRVEESDRTVCLGKHGLLAGALSRAGVMRSIPPDPRDAPSELVARGRDPVAGRIVQERSRTRSPLHANGGIARPSDSVGWSPWQSVLLNPRSVLGSSPRSSPSSGSRARPMPGSLGAGRDPHRRRAARPPGRLPDSAVPGVDARPLGHHGLDARRPRRAVPHDPAVDLGHVHEDRRHARCDRPRAQHEPRSPVAGLRDPGGHQPEDAGGGVPDGRPRRHRRRRRGRPRTTHATRERGAQPCAARRSRRADHGALRRARRGRGAHRRPREDHQEAPEGHRQGHDGGRHPPLDSVSQSLSSLPIPKGIDPTKVRAQRPR